MTSPESSGFTLPSEASFMVFVGKQRSGKSYAIKSLINQFQKKQPFRFGIVFTKTKFNHAYDYIPDKYVRDNFTVPRLTAYIEKLREIQGEKRKKDPEDGIAPNFLILDDLMGVINWYDPWMISWVSTFRHTNTWVFLAAQYLAQGTSTVVRECTNSAFMFNTSNRNSQKQLCDFYGQQMPSGQRQGDLFNTFQATMKAVTESENEEDEHQCLLFIANKKTSEKSYFAWKADPVDDDFMMKFSDAKPESVE